MPGFIRAWATWNANLYVCNSPLDAGLWRSFEVTAPTHFTVTGHIGLKHRANYDGPLQLCGWGVRGALRGPCASQAALNAIQCGPGANMPNWLPGCKDAGNLNIEEHYATAHVTGYALLQNPGWYRWEVWGGCHGSTAGSTLGPNDSVVEINGEGGAYDPYNNLIIRLDTA